ncbi:unnamed protein product [Sympodiomycopsis kandeliae]
MSSDQCEDATPADTGVIEINDSLDTTPSVSSIPMPPHRSNSNTSSRDDLISPASLKSSTQILPSPSTPTPVTTALSPPNTSSKQPGSPATPYGNLSYAPRQSSFRNSPASSSIGNTSGAKAATSLGGSRTPSTSKDTPFKATQSGFVSHSTFLASQTQQQDIVAQSKPSSSSLLAAPKLDTHNATSGESSQQSTGQKLRQVLDECEKIGLNQSSPGYALVRQLADPEDPQWRELARIVTSSQAILLLPVAFKASKARPTQDSQPGSIDLAFAQDHIFFPASAGRVGEASDKGFVTLSGLRGSQEEIAESKHNRSKVVIKSFITRNDRNWMTELKNNDSRRALMSSHNVLPEPSCTDYPYPNYPILTQAEVSLLVPSSSPHRSRATSSSSLTAPNLNLGPPIASPGHRSTASTGFASLFGGRDRARNTPAMEASVAPGSSPSPATELASPSQQPTAATRSVTVWLIDRPLRRSRALRGMIHSVQSRLLKQLEREGGIPYEIGQVVSSFAGAFYPPVESNQQGRSSPHGRSRSSTGVSTGSSNSASHDSASNASYPHPSPIYASPPEEVAVCFQELYASMQEQLEQSKVTSNGPAGTTEQIEVVERLLTQELYDRIFSPLHSSDRVADKNLSTRVAALNLLGLDWSGLGLDLPSAAKDIKGEESDSKPDAQVAPNVREGLEAILTQCTSALQLLQSRECLSPKAKMEVLVAVHRIIVEGLDKLPAIKFKADSNQPPPGDTSNESQTQEGKRSSESHNTSSADLILPILIRLIVAANPVALASQLLFIQRYRNEKLLSNGEAAYCLINFQAAVQFIENAKPAELGLDDEALSVMLQEEGGKGEKSAAVEMLKHVRQEQAGGSAAADMPVVGRMKGLTGVVNSSFSVLGRVLGSGASAGMEVWDRGSKNIEGVRTLDDIRSLLGGSMAKSANTTKELVNLIREKDREGNEGEPSSPTKAFSNAVRKRASSIRSIGSVKSIQAAPLQSQGTDYSKDDEKEKDLAAAFDLTAVRSEANKPSLSDRLANLNWKFGVNSPSGTPKELPSTIEESGSPAVPTPLQQQPPSALLSPGYPAASSSSLTAPSTPRTPGSVHSPTSYDRELPGPPPPGKTDRQAPLSSGSGQRSFDRSPMRSYFPPTDPLPASLQSPYAPLHQPPVAERPVHVVIASSGSVASIKIPLMVEKLLEYSNVRVQVIATESSCHFYNRDQIAELGYEAASKSATGRKSADSTSPYTVSCLAQENLSASRGAPSPDSQSTLPLSHVWTDSDEWTSWKKVGDPILHIELRRWADIVLVAPCSANTLAKISNGICDNLLTSFLRALSPHTPTILYPAMNTLMYLHPFTAKQLKIVTEELGYMVQGPIEKKLACGDLGAGAMVEWSDIVQGVVDRFGLVRR